MFPGGSNGKASAYNAGDPGSIPGSGRSPGEGNGNPLQYPGDCCLSILYIIANLKFIILPSPNLPTPQDPQVCSYI